MIFFAPGAGWNWVEKLGISLLLSLTSSLTASLFIQKKYLGPLNILESVVEDLKEGNIVRHANLDFGGDFLKMAGAIKNLKENMRKSLWQITSNSTSLTISSKNISKLFSQMNENSKKQAARISNVTAEGAAASEYVKDVSKIMANLSQSVTPLTHSVSEMKSSLYKISEICNMESKMIQSGTEKVQKTQTMISKLRSSAMEIGKVIDVINEIAEQTNLLALNATLEASAAGEYGKGFAVVAAEVKTLAKQSAQATLNIEKQIQDIQNGSQYVMESIKEITQIVSKVYSNSKEIVKSVESQFHSMDSVVSTLQLTHSSASEVEGRMNQSSDNLHNISDNLQSVNESAKETSNMISEVTGDLSQMAVLADNLQKIVNHFKVSNNSKRLGDYLVDLKFISEKDLLQVLKEQNANIHKGKRLGDLLIEKGLVTKQQFEKAIQIKMENDAKS